MATKNNLDPDLLKSLQWRSIGAHRGGRVVAVAGDPANPMVFYFGACAGGVWKTVDGGTYWENISDGFFKTASVGAIAVSESDPNVIYAGMGESCIRGNVSHGDGVYKSTDGGKSWENIGLKNTRHISRVRVHPNDPDLVYVAAFGNAFGENKERGVFRSRDGGQSWVKVLFRSERAGACDLSMDPNNPRILYAAIWDALRQPWMLRSGGPDSSLYKSINSGDTWTEITNSPGLPTGLKGRIGVSASPARVDRVWAIVEAEDWTGGLFRSDNGGCTWECVSEDRDLQQRPWYYSHVFADPQDPNTVYVLALKTWKSTDGGHTFNPITMPHGDNHDLWLDPNDNRRMIEGNDGGACVSFNGGDTWSTIYNQPTAQYYHVATDNQHPYRVYGTQQDNTAISVPSRSFKGAISWNDCYPVGNSESGHIAVHPEDANIVYSGAIGSSPGGGDSLLRYDHRTGQVRIVTIWPEFVWGRGLKDHKYRFQWTYPIVISPHDPGILYAAANVLFRSENEGSSWEIVSPDLTRNDRSKMEPSGGPITLDTSYVEHYGTIFSFVESPHEKGVFWVGSDDGLMHISKDGGKTWDNITPPELEPWTLISNIEVSHHDPSTAYIAGTRYKLNDQRPYIYKTKDFGKTWTKLTNGIPEDDFTRVIREDPYKPGLLYTGTELGVYISFNDGASWQPLQCNLPAVPIHDLTVKGTELIAATHGRSFWILDDLSLLRQLSEQTTNTPLHLFEPSPTYRIPLRMSAERKSNKTSGPGKNYGIGLGVAATFREHETPHGEIIRTFLDAGHNPPDGVVVTYYLQQKPKTETTLTFLNDTGQTVNSFSSHIQNSMTPQQPTKKPVIPAEAGMNRFVWDMKYESPNVIQETCSPEEPLAGPMIIPGIYEVKLKVDEQSQTQTIKILKDPRITTTIEDFEAQLDLLKKITEKLSATHDSINQIRKITRQIEEWIEKAKDHNATKSISDKGNEIKLKLADIENALFQPKTKGNLNNISFPGKLSEKLVSLTSVVSSADNEPTKQSHDVFKSLSDQADSQFKTLKETIDKDISAFINLLNEMDIPAIIP